MASTEATVREALVNAIKEIARSDLGFDVNDGNVKDYFPEFHQRERPQSYFQASVGGKPRIRVWAVQVLGTDNFFVSDFNGRFRTYDIRVRCYYERGVDGEDVNTVIDHLRVVRGAILDLETNLSGTVTRATELRTESPRIEDAPDGLNAAEMIVGEIAITADKELPDF